MRPRVWVDDVHGDDLFGKAVVVLGGAIMQLADRHYTMAGRARPVMPAFHRSVVGIGVVPKADLMHVTAVAKIARAGMHTGEFV
jgi:hypothetical protein